MEYGTTDKETKLKWELHQMKIKYNATLKAAIGDGMGMRIGLQSGNQNANMGTGMKPSRMLM